MLTFIVTILMLWLGFKILGFTLKLGFGVLGIALRLLWIPVVLIFVLIGGLIQLAIPVLLIAGGVYLFQGIMRRC